MTERFVCTSVTGGSLSLSPVDLNIRSELRFHHHFNWYPVVRIPQELNLPIEHYSDIQSAPFIIRANRLEPAILFNDSELDLPKSRFDVKSFPKKVTADVPILIENIPVTPYVNFRKMFKQLIVENRIFAGLYSLTQGLTKIKENLNSVVIGSVDAKKLLGRPVVNGIETAVFSVWYGIMSGNTQDRNQVSFAIRLQDILERQNCYGDDHVNGSSVNPYWERNHFKIEYDNLLKDMKDYLEQKYGVSDGSKRYFVIESGLKSWFDVNWTVENFLANNVRPTVDFNSDDELLSILDKIRDYTPENAAIYRSFVDEKWVKCIVLTLTDGDEKKTSETLKQVLSATLIFQLSEDFANVARDSKLKKMNLFLDKTDETLLVRIQNLIEKGKENFTDLTLNPGIKEILKCLWIFRSLYAYFKASLHGNNWRGQKMYDQCNLKEEYRTQSFA
jgi:hypothetical protein